MFATPVPSCGLFLSDEEVSIAVGLGIGLPLILPHVCVCGGMMARAKVQSIKEPPGLCRDGKRPDGASVIPWRRGRDVTWDVTVTDTFAASYVRDTAVRAGAPAERARRRRKLRSTMNCVAITFSSRWLAK